MSTASTLRSVRVCLRTLGTAALLSGAASAMAITINFSGSGLVTGPAQTPPVLSGLTMGSATSDYIVAGEGGWHVDKVFSFNVATLVGGGNWTLSNGSSSLTGMFTSSRADSTSPTALLYTVTGGTGSFAGYTGSGVATGSTAGNPFGLPAAVVTFTESGAFNVSAVPEPAMGWLLAAGLAAVAWRVRRGVFAQAAVR
jgi:hypothetical protein